MERSRIPTEISHLPGHLYAVDDRHVGGPVLVSAMKEWLVETASSNIVDPKQVLEFAADFLLLLASPALLSL